MESKFFFYCVTISGESKHVLVVYNTEAVSINVSSFTTMIAQMATHDEEAAYSTVIRAWSATPSSDEMPPHLKADLQKFHGGRSSGQVPPGASRSHRSKDQKSESKIFDRYGAEVNRRKLTRRRVVLTRANDPEEGLLLESEPTRNARAVNRRVIFCFIGHPDDSELEMGFPPRGQQLGQSCSRRQRSTLGPSRMSYTSPISRNARMFSLRIALRMWTAALICWRLVQQIL